MLQVTYDIWQLTHDMWLMTYDTLHMTGWVMWTFSQNLSSLALTVWDWRCFEDLEENDESVNELFIDKGVCRTAPATPGLLIK